MTKTLQKPNLGKGSTAFHWTLLLFFVAIVATNLHADMISMQFNEKIIFSDKAEGKNQAVFELGSPIDFSSGSVSFWVRPEWYGGEKSVIPLINIVDNSGTGIRLTKAIWNKSIQFEGLSNGRVTGRVYKEIADWIPGFSHHVAATWSKDELCLYIDGVNNALIHRGAALNWKPNAPSPLQIRSVTVGGPRTSITNLLLTDHVLSAENITCIIKKQCPVRLQVEIPERSPRIIYPGESVKLRVKNDGEQSAKTRLTYTVDNFTSEAPVVEKEETLDVTIPAYGGTQTKEIVIPKFGLFQVSAELRSLNGEILSQDSRVFGSGMRAPDIKIVGDSQFGWNVLPPLTDYVVPIAQIGATWIKGEFHLWEMVEPEKGAFDWTKMDERVRCLDEVGIHYLPYLYGTPKWASATPDNKNFDLSWPTNLEDWSNYVYTVVNRYKASINTWEVWGEPNAVISKEELLGYFNVHKTAYLAAKKADPQVRIVGPCFQGFDRSWFESQIKLGLLDYTDIVSWHIYTAANSPESVNLEKRLKEFVKIVRDAGGKQPIWNTESGYWTAERITTAPVPKNILAELIGKQDPVYYWNHWLKHALDEWTAANYNVRFDLINFASGVEKVFPFLYSQDYIFGTIDKNNSPYLHTLAYNNLTRQLAGLKFLQKVPAHSDARYVYLFSDGKSTIATVWTTDEIDSIVLNVGNTNPKVSDLFGNPVKTALKNGKLTVPLSGSPQYIEGISPDVECQKDFMLVECPEIIHDSQPITLTADLENFGDDIMSGLASISLPEGWKTKNNNLEFQLKGGEKKRLEFAIAAEAPNGMYAVKMIAEISGAEKTVNTKHVLIRKPALCYPHLNANTDGAPLSLSRRSQVIKGLLMEGQALADAVDVWKGPADSSATILPGWDKDNFYLTIDVVDKSICTDMSAPWKGDCIELFIDEAGTKDNVRSETDAKCSQIFLIPEGDGKIVCHKPEKIKNAKVSMKKTDSGYRIEASLPWENFPGITPRRGTVFGFDAYVDNADPNPTTGKPESMSTIAWEGKIGNFSDASRYGRIMLTENIVLK